MKRIALHERARVDKFKRTESKKPELGRDWSGKDQGVNYVKLQSFCLEWNVLELDIGNAPVVSPMHLIP